MVDHKEFISRIDLRQLLSPQGRIPRGNKPLMIRCPWHDDRHSSLGIWTDHLHCFGCGVHKSTLDYLADLENLDLSRDFKHSVEVLVAKYGTGTLPSRVPVARRPVEKPNRVTPMDSDVAKKYHDSLGERRQWYRDRGLGDGIIDGQLLGYNGRAFTIPVWYPTGQLLTIRFRRDDSLGSSGPKYWGIEGRNDTLLFNQGALRDNSRMAVICEGELDCLRLWQEGISAVSSTNGTGGMLSLWERIKPLFRCEHIVVAFDQDESGRKAGRELIRMINSRSIRSVSHRRAVVLKWNRKLGKDVTELAQKKGITYLRGLIEEVSYV